MAIGWMSCLRAMSPTMPCARGCSAARRSTRWRSRATNATSAPPASSSRTSASPRPEVPPVTATRTASNGVAVFLNIIIYLVRSLAQAVDFVNIVLYKWTMPPLSFPAVERSTRRAIVKLLKTEGAMDSAQLAARLRLTPMAVRQHLYALQREQLVTADELPVPMGLPAKHWRLTRESDRLFPDASADLNVALIDA